MTQPPSPPRLGPNAPLDSQLQKLRKRLARPNQELVEPSREAATHKEEDFTSTLWMLLATLRRRFLLVTFFSLLCGVGSYYWTKAKPKQYRTSTTVEVIAFSPKVFTNIREVVNYNYQMRLFYTTQVEILRSLPIYKKAINLHPAFLEDPGFFGLDNVRDPEKRKRMMSKLRPRAALILKGKTSVQAIRRSSLMRITVSDTDPNRARDLANAVVKAYQEHDRLFRLRATLNAYSEIKLRLEEYQARNKKLQQQIMNFRNQHNILTTSLNDRRGLAFKQLEELNLRGIQVMFKRISHESMLGPYLKPAPIKDPNQIYFLPLLEDKLVQQLKEDYNKVMLLKTEAVTRYRARHPEMQKINRRVTYLHDTLLRQIEQVLETYRGQYKALRREESILRKKTYNAKRQLQELDRLNLSLDDLRQQQTALNESLRVLNKRYFELQLLKDSTTTNVRMIEPPLTPMRPFAPRVFRATVTTTVLGFLALFGLFLLLELLDRSVRSLADIEEKVGITPIGEVPLLQNKKTKAKKEPLYNPDQPISAIEEAIRSVRTNIFFMASDQRKLRMLFTSPSPREGKTFIATNVAIGIAHAGKRTILIDTDMRRPRVHKILQLDYDRSKGASSVIIGQHSLEEAMIRSDYPNLWILPCGPIPPSPTELLQTDGFHKLFRELEEKFDAIIFDTPPILNVTDAAVLSAYVDGCVLISSSGSTTWNALRAARYKLESVGGRIFGCILNKLSERDRTYAYQRGYHYSAYRYHYYGESDE
ncbi:MAG: polysaccharide biosynthesis tyrosine autokinase [Myxococcales bacterium]|nr:polysaccharide biosynthesis tyrosine autokinase [Myxococcales bacterium]